MAFTQTQINAINQLAARGLSPSGQPLSTQQKDAITQLSKRGIDAATIFDTSDLQPTGTAPSTTQIPLLQQIKSLQPTGVAGVGSEFLKGAFSPQAAAQFPALAPLARGGLEGILNVPIGAAQALGAPIKKVQFPGTKTGFGELGSLIGTVAGTAPLIAGGEAAAGSALERAGIERAAPLLRKLVPSIKGAVGFGLGAIPQDPKHRLQAAGIGALTGFAAPVIPLSLRKLFGSNASKELAQTVLDELSGGTHTANPATSLEDNARSAASDIRNLRSGLLKEYQSQIGSVLDDGEKVPIKDTEYSNSIENVNKLGGFSTKEAQKKFLEDPNLLTAHNLQSTLGADIRSFRPTSLEGRNQLELLARGRQALKNDIAESLTSHDPAGELAQRYQGSSDFYRNNIVPFNSNENLLKLSKGEIKNPKNLSTIFSAPSDDTINILDKLPQSFRNKVIYDILGRTQKTIKPKRLVTAIDSLDQKGLSTHYLSEDILNARDLIKQQAKHEQGVLPRIIRGGVIRIPEWLIAGTALRLGLPLARRDL